MSEHLNKLDAHLKHALAVWRVRSQYGDQAEPSVVVLVLVRLQRLASVNENSAIPASVLPGRSS